MNKWLKKFIINTTSVAVAVIMLASCSLKDYAVKARNAVPAAIQVTTEETILNQSVDSAVLYGTEKTAVTSKTEKQYVKDVKFIHGENLAEAKKALPEGYTLLETDLNQGAAYITAVDDVYMAYSTTPNPDEAVTDIKMMNMKGGFVVSDYDSQIDEVSANIRAMVQEFKQAVNTFVENYKIGTSGAKAAYVTLSAFTVDEQDNKSLADYFIYSDVPDGFYLKLLLNAHTDILSSILSALTMAVQGEKGDTWLDRLAKIEDPTLAMLSDDELQNVLHGYLVSAIAKHRICEHDLSDRDDELMQFNVTLSDIELEIIGLLMAREWVSQQLLSVTNTLQVFSGKETNYY